VGIVVILALLSSLFYGASDFLGAVSSRRLTVITASASIYAAATVCVGIGFAFVPSNFSANAFWSGSIAGLFAIVGMVTFYAALAIGPMSLLAPLIALIQTAVPVLVAATTGQPLTVTIWVAVALALVASALISIPAGAAVTRISLRGAILAIVSGVTLGFTVVALDTAPPDSGIYPAFLDVAVGLVILVPLVAIRRLRVSDEWLRGHAVAGTPMVPEAADRVGIRTWVVSAVAGVLLGVGNILLIIALHEGNLAVVAVLLSLYPLTTVILARFVLKERMSLPQLVGVALAVAAAVLLGLS
jgi:drug/metabolite transporter (DMT)-like permease